MQFIAIDTPDYHRLAVACQGLRFRAAHRSDGHIVDGTDGERYFGFQLEAYVFARVILVHMRRDLELDAQFEKLYREIRAAGDLGAELGIGKQIHHLDARRPVIHREGVRVRQQLGLVVGYQGIDEGPDIHVVVEQSKEHLPDLRNHRRHVEAPVKVASVDELAPLHVVRIAAEEGPVEIFIGKGIG